MSGVATLGLGRGRSEGGDPNFQLDVGSVLSRTVNIWGQNLVSFSLVGLVAYSPVFLLIAVLAATDTFKAGLERSVDLATNLFTIVLTGAVTYGVFRHLHGERAGAADVLRVGMARFGGVLITAIFVFLATALGCCLLVIPGFLVLVRFWVAVPVVVIESNGVSAALSRSELLTAGNRWQVFAIAILMGVFSMVATLLIGGSALLLVAAARGTSLEWGTESLGPVAQAVITLVSIPLNVLGAVAPAVVYHDLRVGKEGADVAELLRVFE
jgi:hypothetical protein